MGFEDNWSDSPPSQFDRSEAVSQFKQYIFENWKRGEGPCDGCPNHALKKKCFPSLGSGFAEAEIMIVGNSPGPRDRTELEINNKTRMIDPDELTNHPDFNGYPLSSFYDYTIEDIKSWTGIGTLRKRLIEDNRGLGTEIDSGKIYFTNAKKCSNIKGRDNDEAVSNCSSFLEKEIEIVDPSILVTWGLQAATGTAKAVGYDVSRLPNQTTALPSGDKQPIDSYIGYRETPTRYPDFITMPHWAFLGPNVGSISGFDANEYDNPEIQLYYDLSDLIDYFIE